jgi:hypothetical protein
MHEFLWFLSGAILYKFLSKLLGLYQLFAFFHEIQLHVIAMLIAASEDLEGAASIKHEMLTDASVPPEEVESLELIDDSIISSWKRASIVSLNKVTPRSFQSLSTFETWEEAVDYYDQTVKK